MRLSARILALPIAALVALPLAMTPASAVPMAATKTLIVRDLPAQVRLVPGEKVKIVLSTNLTTGYSWTAQGGCCTKDDKNIARVAKGVYTAPDNTNGMVGVPGTTTWTITALRTGTTDITIVTSPPGSTNTMNDEEVGQLHLIVMKK